MNRPLFYMSAILILILHGCTDLGSYDRNSNYYLVRALGCHIEIPKEFVIHTNETEVFYFRNIAERIEDLGPDQSRSRIRIAEISEDNDLESAVDGVGDRYTILELKVSNNFKLKQVSRDGNHVMFEISNNKQSISFWGTFFELAYVQDVFDKCSDQLM